MSDKWTKDELKKLRKLFPNMATTLVALDFPGRSLECIKKKAQRLGLRKSKKHMRSLGRRT